MSETIISSISMALTTGAAVAVALIVRAFFIMCDNIATIKEKLCDE